MESPVRIKSGYSFWRFMAQSGNKLPAIPALSESLDRMAKSEAMMVIIFPTNSNLNANHLFDTVVEK